MFIRLNDLDEAMTYVELGRGQRHNYFCYTCIDHFTGNCIKLCHCLQIDMSVALSLHD
jgi:hypothetical protein